MREPLQNHSAAEERKTDAPCIMVAVPRFIGASLKRN
jgi:hypothetical protein